MANPNPNTSGLKPIQPGEVRNPNGSSRKQRLTNALIKAIEEKGLDDPFVAVGLKAALRGDFRFWKEIFDRVDGKVTEKVVEEKRVTVVRKQRTRPGGDSSAPTSDAGAGEDIGEAVQRGELRSPMGEDDPGPGSDV